MPENFVVRETKDFVAIIVRSMPEKAAAQGDVKLVEGQKNVWSTLEDPELQRPMERPLDQARAQIIRGEKLLEVLQPEPQPTLGDLSIVTEAKRKEAERWASKPVNRDPNVTVGDLSVVEPDNRRLDELYTGPKTPEANPPSPSQQFLNERARKSQELTRESLEIKELMAAKERREAGSSS